MINFNTNYGPIYDFGYMQYPMNFSYNCDWSIFNAPFGDTNPKFNIFDNYGVGATSDYDMFDFLYSSSDPVMPAINGTPQKGALKVNNRSNNHCLSRRNPSVDRALDLAESQVGVHEVGGSNDSRDIRRYKNGRKDNNPWCASFASWLFGSGQGSNNNATFGYTASSQQIRREAQRKGFYSKSNSGYKPQVGDLMIMSYPNGGKDPVKGHVGIVTKINSDGSFETIEGNHSNQVARVHRSMNTNNLDGFVRMNDWCNA